MTNLRRAAIPASTSMPFVASTAFAQDVLKSVTKGDMAALMIPPNRLPKPAMPFLDANRCSITLPELKANVRFRWCKLRIEWLLGSP